MYKQKIIPLLICLLCLSSLAVTAFAYPVNGEEVGGGTVNELVPISTPSAYSSQVATWYDFIRFKIAPTAMGLVFAWTGLTFFAPAFYGGEASVSQKISESVKLLFYSALSFLIVLLLPNALAIVRDFIGDHAWTPTWKP